ncbi:MAG: cardiolipin synthase [Eubacteriaceae bacterium]|jgi:cardiolipin synthase
MSYDIVYSGSFMGQLTFWVNVGLTITIIFLERKQPSSTYAWLMFLWVFPVLGFIFYVLFSQKFSSRKIYRFRANQIKETKEEVLKQAEELKHRIPRTSPIYPFRKYKDNIEFQNNVSHSLFTPDNEVEIFTDGKALFMKMLDDFRAAKTSINVEFYILKYDGIGKDFIDTLAAKAREGVQVRVLYDELGSRRLPPKARKLLRESGAAEGAFLPSKFAHLIKFFTLRLNYRDHRKIAVIDGKTGYIGGFNVGDEYLGLHKKFGYWRDTHIRIEGPAVTELQLRFIEDWTTNKFEIKNQPIKENLNMLLPVVPGKGDVGIQIVASGPDTVNQNIKQGYIKMINDARHHIYITSPYFVLDESINEALKIALLSGVAVDIIVPDKPDHPFIYPTTMSYAGQLVPYGANVYTYQNGFVHAKLMCIDEELSVVGSCNFDIRSFALNFECSAFLYSREITTQLINDFEHDKTLSMHYTLTAYNNRGKIQKIKESISRLLSPLL